MSRRTGISEAPTVVLGAGGREQFIPVLERFQDTTSQPGKTSIGEMAAFFEGGGLLPIPQIQRFFIDNSPTVVITENGNQAPGTYSAGFNLPMRKGPDSLIVGDLDFYEISNGQIVFPTQGTYRISGELYALITGNAPQQQLTARLTGARAAGNANITGLTASASGRIRDPTVSTQGDVEEGQVSATGQVDNPAVDVSVGVSGGIASFNVPVMGNVNIDNAQIPLASFLNLVGFVTTSTTLVTYFNGGPIYGQPRGFAHVFMKWSNYIRVETNDTLQVVSQVYANGNTATTGSPTQWTFDTQGVTLNSFIIVERISL